MTGAYLRIQRDGEWKNLEVEHLTDAEREQMLGTRDHAELMRWLHCVCKKLAETQTLFDELERDGVIERRLPIDDPRRVSF